MDEKEQGKVYLKQTVGPLLEDMLTELIVQKPSDPIPFLVVWLQQKGGLSLSESEKEELIMLRQEVAVLKGKTRRDSASDHSQDEQDEEFLDDVKSGKKEQRREVSSEAFGTFNKKEDFVPRKIPKTAAQRQRILERLEKSFMFQALEETEREIVVLAMEERTYAPEDSVINQGDDGDVLYVVDSGTLDCFKILQPGEDPTFLKNYGPGDSFGELALLYNVPRAASIKANTEAVLWALDRSCFNHIVKDSAVRRRERYDEFLQHVELLEEMDPYERSQLSDAFKTASFKDGEFVIREGDWGEVFYIVETGAAKATKALTPGAEPSLVQEYGVGDYFGELALLRGEPRAANILAVGDLHCVTLDRHSFKRMLGPLEEILQRNAEKYEEILNRLRGSLD